MVRLYLNTYRQPGSVWGWGCIITGAPGYPRESMGAAEGGEFDALLLALLNGLQSISSLPGTPAVQVLTEHPVIGAIINQGFLRWSNHHWRRESSIPSADSGTWRKLARASRRLLLNVRAPEAIADFELLGRARYFALCGGRRSSVLKLFTDGSFVPKTRRGGWAAIIENGKASTEACGAIACRDCNEAELQAVNNGLSLLSNEDNAIVFTDSQFVINGTQLLDSWLDNNWKTRSRKRVYLRPLWEQLNEHLMRLSVRFEWVKGHSITEQNVRADYLAKREAKKYVQNPIALY